MAIFNLYINLDANEAIEDGHLGAVEPSVFVKAEPFLTNSVEITLVAEFHIKAELSLLSALPYI